MKTAEYYLLDVFTDKPFSGNQLAVFLNADELETSTMQAIANELNLAETVFLGAATTANHYPMRIFTPMSELQFAGHPTVGTAHLLAELNLANREQGIVLQPPVGALAVSYEQEGATFKTALSVMVTGSTLDRLTAVELLGLDIHQVIGDPVIASFGLPFHLIELADLAALEQVQIAGSVWADAVTSSSAGQIYLYVVEQRDNEETIVRSRMFCMHASLCEDPATGSAAAALTGYLASLTPAPLHCKIHQGVEMGRPSVIHTTANGAIEPGFVTVAGHAIIAGEGKLYLDY
ncbi:phenazine biosynthesis protein PhzF [Vreelandella venusta]|uniref:Phenazine biosynthesis protein PhzF n=1 Tax=Halomonas hydrothermalis TaxID=115561 RepID=A0A6F8U8U6_9GAMM|nr:PhzF family phenazine biosynthesis protein [Halomonas hydrothermalis]BCB09360.1 phenazine biosynthesis protein PhzF [Halomonas hydrothermalis]